MMKNIQFLALSILISFTSIAQVDVIIGTGTSSNGSTTYPAPYGNYYEGAKHQILIKASELSALSVPGNTITSLSFQVDVANAEPLHNFNIKMANTSLNALSSWVTTGLTTVYSVPVFTETSGWNQHLFSTPFVWNGTDNIVIEVCFNNDGIVSTYTNNAQMFYSTVGFNAVIYENSDNDPTLCTNPASPSTDSDRPNMKLSFLPDGNYNLKVHELLSPRTSCSLEDTLTARIYNFGDNDTTNFDVTYILDGAAPVTETVTQTIIANSYIDYTFNTPLNYIGTAPHTIEVYTTFAPDTVNDNDTLITSVSIEPAGISAPFMETFDGIADAQTGSLANGWTVNSPTSFAWFSEKTTTPTLSTGPNGDHTSGTGTYMYTESSNGSTNNKSELYSQCIDISSVLGPKLSFWYHKYGSTMGDLLVDIYHNGVWIEGYDSVLGQTQFSNSDAWIKEDISINKFAGSSIKLRFRAQRGNGSTSDMAIDDIKIYEPLANNAVLSKVTNPKTGCSLASNESVTFEILNEGYNTINSLYVYYSINGNTPIKDSISNAILADGKYTYTFTNTADVSVSGVYNFECYVELAGEENTLDDTLKFSIENFTTPTTPLLSNLGTICPNNTTTLNAVGNGMIFWYKTATSKTPLDTGLSFTTPLLFTNSTFYAQSIMSSLEGLGPMAVFGANSGYTNSGGLLFDVLNTDGILIQSVDVNANGAGTVNLTVWSSTNISMFTKTFNVVSGVNTLDLFAYIPTGVDYKMSLTASGTSVNLQRDAVANFPYTLPNQVSITDGTNSGKYYFFYNWKIRTTQCVSSRVSIIQDVGSLHVSLGKDTVICVDESLTLDAGSDFGYDFIWSIDTTKNTSTFVLDGSDYPNDTTFAISVEVVDPAKNCSGKDIIYVSVSNCLGINDNEFNNVKVYPNPTSSSVFIDLNNLNKEDLNLKLFNSLGQQIDIINSSKSGIIEYDISEIDKGIYYLRLENKMSVKAFKLIIE